MRVLTKRCGVLLWLCGVVSCSSLSTDLHLAGEKPHEIPALPAPTPASPPRILSMDGEDWSRVHPLQLPRKEVEQLGLAVPQEIKDRTYLFFVNGLDPYYLANFRGQCQYMKTLGYHHAYCGQMQHAGIFRQKIIQVRQEQPQARIVLVGYSTGANCVRTLANQLHQDHVRIDLLVYLGGDTIKDSERSRPENVGRILNITAHGLILLGGDLFFRGDDIKGANNHRLDARHFMLPTRAEAAELLVQYVVDLDSCPHLDAGAEAQVVPAIWHVPAALPGKN